MASPATVGVPEPESPLLFHWVTVSSRTYLLGVKSRIPSPRYLTDFGIRQRPIAPSTRNCHPSRTDSTSRPRSLGVSYLHGRNDVARFDRRDTVRAATDTDQADLVVDIRGTIYAGSEVGGDGRYVADQIRLEASFDNHLSATAPQSGDTENLVVQRDVDMADDALEHRFAPTSDKTHRRFTACQHSLVIASEMPEPFSYTANGRFRWRNPRFIREDDRWHHHTPGRAVWYPNRS